MLKKGGSSNQYDWCPYLKKEKKKGILDPTQTYLHGECYASMKTEIGGICLQAKEWQRWPASQL